MDRSTGRLSLASDIQSVARLGYDAAEKSWKPPLPLSWQSRFCEAGTRGLTTPHHCEANEGADMAERTRGPDPVDRWTRETGVNITPPTRTGPVTTTHTIA